MVLIIIQLWLYTSTSMERSQSKYRSHSDSTYSHRPIMMTGTTTIEEKIASLTKVIEDMAKQMRLQSEALSNMAGKMHDHEQHNREAKANLRTPYLQEVPSTSKESPTTRLTPPHQASSMSKGKPAKVVKAPYISVDETMPAAQLMEFILGTIKDTQDEAAPHIPISSPTTPTQID
ncbi:hypothetical protein LIER_31462 [Lithospermum erythrorhizon]|uniref:Ty3-gypsy retrotransposon protein n=1 Tax=Lithospermum erythrorhizon TaxID=34254 RepID=A0AAV3RUP9_LITER